MNERIRELAEQAGIPAIDEVWDYNDRNLLVKDNGEWRSAVPSEIISTMIQSERGLEKFAELIVRECVKVMYDNAIERKIPPDINQTPTHYAIAVLEHFGVEND